MAETKLKRGQLEIYRKSFNDIRICPVGIRSTTIATMGIWSDKYRDELLAYAELFASAPTLQAKIDRLEAEKAELVETLKLAGIIIQSEWLNLGYKINRTRNESTRNPLQVARDSLNRIRVKVIAAIAKANPQ